MPSEIRDEERRRLAHGSEPGEIAPGLGVLIARAECGRDSGEVLARCREVMATVIDHQAGEWPADTLWPALLPDWFVHECAPEPTEEEQLAWLARWDRLSEEERQRESESERWTLLAWVHWLQPSERHWWWWDALADGPRMIVVQVVVDDWPTPLGSLVWLLRAAGAKDVEIKE